MLGPPAPPDNPEPLALPARVGEAVESVWLTKVALPGIDGEPVPTLTTVLVTEATTVLVMMAPLDEAGRAELVDRGMLYMAELELEAAVTEKGAESDEAEPWEMVRTKLEPADGGV